MAKNEILPGGVKQSQVNAWKRDHNNEVYAIDVKTPEKTYTAYFKKPDLDILSAASAHKDVPIQAGRVMFDSCWLGGDDEIRDKDEYKASAMKMLGGLFELYEAEIKKL